MTITNSSFNSGEKGEVSAIIQQPNEPQAWMVLAHGAGADMHHTHMQSIADALASIGVGTFRFNFPFFEQKTAGKGGRVDSVSISTGTIRAAIAAFKANGAGHPLIIGGHSFGGRMSSHFGAEDSQNTAGISGLIYFSFPLHPSGKPGIKRAEHLSEIRLPQLFLSGTRDKLAEQPLLADVVATLPKATLHKIETADHSFKILKRSRKSDLDVYEEAAMTIRDWISQIGSQS